MPRDRVDRLFQALVPTLLAGVHQQGAPGLGRSQSPDVAIPGERGDRIHGAGEGSGHRSLRLPPGGKKPLVAPVQQARRSITEAAHQPPQACGKGKTGIVVGDHRRRGSNPEASQSGCENLRSWQRVPPTAPAWGTREVPVQIQVEGAGNVARKVVPPALFRVGKGKPAVEHDTGTGVGQLCRLDQRAGRHGDLRIQQNHDR